MNIEQTIAALDQIAPERLAGDWDNVGLLLEGDRDIKKALVTIDLNAEVLAEALRANVDLLISYHPTIFRGLKRITQRSPLGPVLLQLARQGMHLYSPHSALDAVPGGMNDWLLEAFSGVRGAHPIEPDSIDPTAGVGRIATIEPIAAKAILRAIKRHLHLQHLRVGGSIDREIHTVAVCPGAGTSVFRHLKDVDLLLTGEMSHHDVLSWIARGTLVVLTEHTNTERGYLPRYAASIQDKTGIETIVSTVDTDPLRIL